VKLAVRPSLHHIEQCQCVVERPETQLLLRQQACAHQQLRDIRVRDDCRLKKAYPRDLLELLGGDEAKIDELLRERWPDGNPFDDQPLALGEVHFGAQWAAADDEATAAALPLDGAQHLG
jgi:hypothetical protein